MLEAKQAVSRMTQIKCVQMQMCIHTLRVRLECSHPSYVSFPYPLCGFPKHAAVCCGDERGELSVCVTRQSYVLLH